MVGGSGGSEGVVVIGLELPEPVETGTPNVSATQLIPAVKNAKIALQPDPLESSEEPHPASRSVIRIKDPLISARRFTVLPPVDEFSVRLPVGLLYRYLFAEGCVYIG